MTLYALPQALPRVPVVVRMGNCGVVCDRAVDECDVSGTLRQQSLSWRLAGFSLCSNVVFNNSHLAEARFCRDGLLHIPCIVSQREADALEQRVREELIERRRDGKKEWFGDVYGYEDKGFRWDMKLKLSAEVRTALRAVLACVQPLLERERPSWELVELAAMCTMPGEPCQPVHADTSHIFDAQMVTIFVALHDVDVAHGPTRMYPRTHTDPKFHMGHEQPDEAAAVLCTMNRGDCVLMDSRLLHCGTANVSDRHRYLFYCTWKPPGRRSKGSTSTLLPEYEEKFYLRTWRDWLGAEDPHLFAS